MNSPSDVTVDARGDLFIADTRNHCIRKVAGLAAPLQITADGPALSVASAARRKIRFG